MNLVYRATTSKPKLGQKRVVKNTCTCNVLVCFYLNHSQSIYIVKICYYTASLVTYTLHRRDQKLIIVNVSCHVFMIL